MERLKDDITITGFKGPIQCSLETNGFVSGKELAKSHLRSIVALNLLINDLDEDKDNVLLQFADDIKLGGAAKH